MKKNFLNNKVRANAGWRKELSGGEGVIIQVTVILGGDFLEDFIVVRKEIFRGRLL